MRFQTLPILLGFSLLVVGCSNPSNPDSGADSPKGSDSSKAAKTDNSKSGGGSEQKKRSFKPVKLGGANGTGAASATDDNAHTNDSTNSAPPNIDDVINGLRPIQIVLGKWNGLIQKATTNEIHDWKWDLRTNKEFPSLTVEVPEGTFFSKASITYDPRIKKYLMTTIDDDNLERKFEGEFIADPEDVPEGDGKTVHRTFKLKLSELPNEKNKTRWQYVFNQQKNNRYLVEVYRARGSQQFRRFDTIGAQRDGTSLARSDADYGDRTCVISQGLGTSQVSYKGKSYWVCCSGCAAAFKDDPETWIARFEAKKKEMKKN